MKKNKENKEMANLIEELGWDIDRFSSSGKETYDKILCEIEVQCQCGKWMPEHEVQDGEMYAIEFCSTKCKNKD